MKKKNYKMRQKKKSYCVHSAMLWACPPRVVVAIGELLLTSKITVTTFWLAFGALPHQEKQNARPLHGKFLGRISGRVHPWCLNV